MLERDIGKAEALARRAAAALGEPGIGGGERRRGVGADLRDAGAVAGVGGESAGRRAGRGGGAAGGAGRRGGIGSSEEGRDWA